MRELVSTIKKSVLAFAIMISTCILVGTVDLEVVNAATVVDVVVVNANDVNVRSTPSTSGKKLGKVQNGSILNRYEIRDDGWSCIEYNGKSGYIKSEFLLTTGSTTLSTTTASVAMGSVAGATAVSKSSSDSISNTNSGGMVWLSATGSCYHSINNCGRMNPNKARQVPLSTAIGSYDKCSKCW